MGEGSGLGHVYINSANLIVVLWCACAYVHTYRGHTCASLHVSLKEGVVFFFAWGWDEGRETGALRCYEVPVLVKEETLSMLIFYTGMCLRPRNLGTQD